MDSRDLKYRRWLQHISTHFFNLHKVFLFGDIYYNMIFDKCSKIFWNDVIVACKTLYDNIWLPENANFKEM